MFEAMDYFNYRHKEEAEDKSYYYGFDGGFVGNGLNGRRRSCGGGFFGGGLGCGLGGGVSLEGGAVLVSYSFANGTQACFDFRGNVDIGMLGRVISDYVLNDRNN